MNLLQIIADAAPALPDSVPSRAQEMEVLRSLPFDELMTRLVNSAVSFAINLLIAIVVFYVGRLIVNKLYRFVSGIFIRRNIDRSLTTFVLSMVRIVLSFILLVTVIGILGIETSSFIAIFASAGVAIGMALSGTLQNFAGGVLILLLKPYKIGDYIEAQGYAGTVREIQIFHTVVCTPDNKAIIIPNGGLSTGSINNWSRESHRRVDWVIGISYGDDVEAARQKILEILAADPRVLKGDEKLDSDIADDRQREAAEARAADSRGFMARLFHRKAAAVVAGGASPQPVSSLITPAPDRTPTVKLSELAASSVDLKVTAWVRTADYWGVFYSVNEEIYNQLPAAGVSFPFPQLDVHLPADAK